MKFKKYMEEFKQISGVISVGIIQDFSCPEINEDEEESFKKFVEDLCYIINKKILDLSIKNFMFKSSLKTIYGYYEQSILLILYVYNSININILKSKIDEFLNYILIHF